MKVLLFTYFFPPSGGVSCQHDLRFAKYLPRFGVDVVIVTTGDPVPWRFLDFDQMRKIEQMNVERIPAGLKFYEHRFSIKGFIQGLKSLRRGDPTYCWSDAVSEKLPEILKKHKPDAVMVTIPPMSALKIAETICEQVPNMPLFLDIRDMLWIYHPYGSFIRRTANKMQRNAIEPLWRSMTRKARGIVVLDESYIPSIENKNIAVIPTPFDPDDFSEALEHEPERFTILYAGSFHRFKDPYELGRVLSCLPDDVLSEIEFIFLGTTHPLRALSWLPKVKFIPFKPHSEVTRFLRKASVNLAFVNADGEAGMQVIPGKIYDYIGAGKPILALGPQENAMRRIVDGLGVFASINNLDLSAGEIVRLFRMWQNGEDFKINFKKREQFSANHVVPKLAEFLKLNI